MLEMPRRHLSPRPYISTESRVPLPRHAFAAFTCVRTAWCTCVLFMVPLSAHAYLDPGTGSLIFQSLLAVLFGIGVAFRQLRAWIARGWHWLLRRPPPDRADDNRKGDAGSDRE